jgi:DnaK suppressor protein
MNNPASVRDQAFIAKQRCKLVEELRKLSSTIHNGENENRLADLAARGLAGETEDQAQELSITQNNRALIGSLAQQQRAIDRALAKIEEGTYGFSDDSGLPIPLARLLAYPQAVRTTAEEAVHRQNEPLNDG